MFKRGIVSRAAAFSIAISIFLTGCSARTEDHTLSTVVSPANASPTAVVISQPKVAPAPVAEAPFFLPIIELSGDSEAIGRQHADQLGDSIRDLHSKYLGRYFSNNIQRVLAMGMASAFESRLSPAHRQEVHALAENSKIDEQQIMLAQCFLDLSPMTACSTVTLEASASTDGVARFGRNLDFASFNIADKYTVVMIVRPEGKNAFASIAWPGMVGVLSGMNEHGLALANMEVTRAQRLPDAMPYTLLYRSILENCDTVDEAIAFLEKTPRQTANNLMLMDTSGERAVAEITPSKVIVRRGAAGEALISTNHQRGDDTTTTGRCRRYDTIRAESADAFGRIDLGAVERMLKDSSPGKATLQSMVFEPTTQVLYLSAGENAAAKPFARLDLKPFFAHR